MLRPALLHYYRALLVRSNGAHIEELAAEARDPEAFVIGVLEAELAPLVAQAEDSLGCRRAYARVVLALADDARYLRQRAEELVREASGLEELAESLGRSDTARFWDLVDEVLEEEWVGHGFQEEERRKAVWRGRCGTQRS